MKIILWVCLYSLLLTGCEAWIGSSHHRSVVGIEIGQEDQTPVIHKS